MPKIAETMTKITREDGSVVMVHLAAESCILQLATHPSMTETEKRDAFLSYYPGEGEFYDAKLEENKEGLAMIKQMTAGLAGMLDFSNFPKK